MIARLNLGGPAHQVSLLSGRRLDPDRYETLLVHGSLPPGERSAAHLAEREGARRIHLPSLRQPISPAEDARASYELQRLIARYRPHIVHTHTAKAGFLGRSAALAGPGPRPKLVHTFHGHVLEGYFGPAKSGVYRRLERLLAARTDVLVGVSDATVADLVRLGIAGEERFRTVRLGLDLERLVEQASVPGAGAAIRAELGLAPADVVCTFIGRFAPVKRVDRLIEAFAVARRLDERARLLIVGDGPDRPALEGRAREAGIESAVHFAGYRADLAGIFAASDLAVISSENEGTPVSLIEAGACGCPGVSFDVGGVSEVVGSDAGLLVPASHVAALGEAIGSLVADDELRRRTGEAARTRMRARYGIDRLIEDIDSLYEGLPAGPKLLATR